jgi:hypothetical protein
VKSPMLDPCAGTGGLCRGLMALEPGVRVLGSDLHPDLTTGADVYGVAEPVDATIVADLEMALRVTGATGIVSNPPYDRRLNPAIVQVSLTLLRRRVISVMILMHKMQYALASDVGCGETMDPLYTITIACTWRTRLFTPQRGDTQPKYSHAWQVWTEHGRNDLDVYPVCPINLQEARAVG